MCSGIDSNRFDIRTVVYFMGGFVMTTKFISDGSTVKRIIKIYDCKECGNPCQIVSFNDMNPPEICPYQLGKDKPKWVKVI